jgi:hypothetical protein
MRVAAAGLVGPCEYNQRGKRTKLEFINRIYSRSISTLLLLSVKVKTIFFVAIFRASSHLCLRDSSCSLGLIVFIWPKTIFFGILICFAFATRYTNEPDGKNSINNQQQQAAAHLTSFFFVFCLRHWGGNGLHTQTCWEQWHSHHSELILISATNSQLKCIKRYFMF